MREKPSTAAGYNPDLTGLVHSTCLYVATVLGDLLEHITIVGGLVPTLLVPSALLPMGAEAHVGTMDLDLGLALAMLDDSKYTEVSKRLRQAGFEPDVNDDGNMTRQRWRVATAEGSYVTLDFLISPPDSRARAGRLKDLERDFAAIVTAGLDLAFRDRERVRLSGTTIHGESTSREMFVCGPGAFIVLKALAFRSRGENKDAYDIFYIVRNFGSGPQDVAARLGPLLDHDDAKRAVTILRDDFGQHDGVGPSRVARFLRGAKDDEIQADVVGLVAELLRMCSDGS